MKAQNPSTSHPSQKQNLVVYTEELTHLWDTEGDVHPRPRYAKEAELFCFLRPSPRHDYIRYVDTAFQKFMYFFELSRSSCCCSLGTGLQENDLI